MAQRLDDAEKKYYKRVEELLAGEESDSVFSSNVLKQIQSDGVDRVFCDKDGSRTIERLVQAPDCDLSVVKALIEPIIPTFNAVASDRCGSHSLEAVVKAVGRLLGRGDPEGLQVLLLAICSELKGCLGDLLSHPHAGHVVAALAQVLGGVYIADHLTRSRYSREFRKAKMEVEEQHKKVVVSRKVAVPPDFTEMLDKLGKWTCKLENFDALLVHPSASPVLQVLLRVLVERLPKRGNRMIRKILQCVTTSDSTTHNKRTLNHPTESNEESSDSKGNGELSPLCVSPVGSHLMEVVVEVASDDLHHWIYESCFDGRALKFALHPLANYPLQQFMTVADQDQLSVILTQLLPHLEDVLYVGHSGVVVKIIQAGLRCPDMQGEILGQLLAAFHSSADPKSCVPLFLTLTAYEVYFNKEENHPIRTPQVQGSLMVQALLKYEHPQPVALSFLKMMSDDVIRVSCDPVSSHVIDAFMSSPTVSLKRKTKLIETIALHLLPLCTDKHGSRVVDAVWRNCEVTKKESLAQEILSHEAELSKDFYGQIVLRNCNISHYRRKQAVWQEREKISENTRDLFRDILEEPGTEMIARKRKRRERDEEGEEKKEEEEEEEKKEKESDTEVVFSAKVDTAAFRVGTGKKRKKKVDVEEELREAVTIAHTEKRKRKTVPLFVD